MFLFPFWKTVHTVPTPFTVCVNCSVTIVATQSLQLGTVSDNFQLYLVISRSCFYRNYCCCVFFLLFLKNDRFNFSVTSSIKFFEKLKFPESFDLHNSSNCLNNVANLLKPPIFQVNKCEYKPAFSYILVECHIPPASPVNVPIESRSLRQNGTVPSNRIYKMLEIYFIHVVLPTNKLKLSFYASSLRKL